MTAHSDRLIAALADRYRIERLLGEGGMATVYLAADLRHDRKVAIKVLRPELAAAIGAARFISEIRTTANLQHPHILSLHDSGEADGTVFYVMPFVDGESLRDRLTRERQLPIDDSLRIATEVADALQYAHDQGVIHRDIKPENILLHGGHALVADFGIALAASSAAGTRMTETGMSLGTPQYMSPEQAMGERTVDARSDVYALGVVAYEMLAGEPPFTGPTAQAIVAKSLASEPTRLGSLRQTVPSHVDAAVHTALQKIPSDRFKSARDFAESLAGRGSGRQPTPSSVSAHRPSWAARVFVPTTVGLAALAVGLWLGQSNKGATPVSGPAVEFTIELDSGSALSGDREFAVSADGHRLVYHVSKAQGSGLYVRDLDNPTARFIPGTDAARAPFFSPDGQEIGYVIGSTLMSISITGGAPRRIGQITGGVFYEAEWISRDTIVTSVNVGGTDHRMIRMLVASGATSPLSGHDSTSQGSAPTLLPDGRAIVYQRYVAAVEQPELMVMELSTGRSSALGAQGHAPRYLPSGELLYVTAQMEVVARPFDLTTRSFGVGAARRVASPVRAVIGGTFPSVWASPSGVVMFEPASSLSDVVEVDRSGSERTLFRELAVAAPRYAPSGDRLAYATTHAGARAGLWMRSVSDSGASFLLPADATVRGLSWSHDGRFLVTSNAMRGEGADLVATDGSGRVTSLTHPGSVMRHPVFDGSSRIVYTGSVSGNRDLYLRRLDGDSTPVRLTSAPSVERLAAVSPDGRWVAFDSDRSGTREVYVAPLAAEGTATLVSAGGGTEPAWSPRDDGELFYRNGNALVSARLDRVNGITVRDRRQLFTRTFDQESWGRNYDVHRDGARFLFVRSNVGRRLHVIVNAGASRNKSEAAPR